MLELRHFVEASRGELARKGTLTLTSAELNSAAWWIAEPLETVRRRWGRDPVLTSFVRTVEIEGSRRGQVETGAHGRRSTRAGNALDFAVPGVSTRLVALGLWLDFPGLFQVLDEGDHVHVTRQSHPGSTAGLHQGYDKPGGGVGVRRISTRDGLTDSERAAGRAPITLRGTATVPGNPGPLEPITPVGNGGSSPVGNQPGGGQIVVQMGDGSGVLLPVLLLLFAGLALVLLLR